MKKLFVHIGTHKTGTKSIQQWLHDHSEYLSTQIFVPQTGMTPGFTGHHNLAWEAVQEPSFKPEYGTINDMLASLQGERAVISSEDFEYLCAHEERLRYFDQTCIAQGWQPHYLAFFRSPSDYAVSLHTTLGKMKKAKNFMSFLQEIKNTGRITCNDGRWTFLFDATEFSHQWNRAVEIPVQILNYDQAVAGKGLITTFADALEIKDPPQLKKWEHVTKKVHLGMITRILYPAKKLLARIILPL